MPEKLTDLPGVADYLADHPDGPADVAAATVWGIIDNSDDRAHDGATVFGDPEDGWLIVINNNGPAAVNDVDDIAKLVAMLDPAD